MANKPKNKIFIFPINHAVIFFSSIIIIFSPVSKKNIIKITQAPLEWKTYTNDQFGFEFQYPNNWAITTESLLESILSLWKVRELNDYEKKFGYFSDISFSSQSNISLSDYVKENYPKDDPEVNKITKTELNGYEAYYVDICGHFCNTKIVIGGHKIIVISLYNISSQLEITPEINQILSTFKFIK